MDKDAELARAWAAAIARRGFVPMGVGELEQLLLSLARRILGPDQPDGREIGAAMVAAHLTDPEALAVTLDVLDAHLPPGPRLSALRGEVASGYAHQLRAVTLAEQEVLARAIIDAQAQVERAARQSEARFGAIFAKAAIGIGISDEHGRIVQVNQALADMLGYRQEEMRGMNVLEMTHPSDPPEMWQQYEKMARGEVDHLRMEKAYYRRDGAVVWTDLTVSQLRDEQGRPQFNVAVIDDVTERHHLQERLRHQATHDPLTGLPNRSLFTDRLAEVVAAAGAGDRLGVCYLDLDGFKRINDTLGHDIGDRLLTMVAERLGECAAERGHLAARMGGDEFVILVEHSAGPDQLAELAEAALRTLDTPVAVGRHRLRVTASIGVVERPAAGADPAEILKAADVTLYRAKAAGRGRWALYDPHAVAAQVARYELSAALPDALDRGEFSLVYQPIVALPDGKLLGMEALVRWNHPRLGTLTPDQFIGLAEETGVIVPLGRQVLWQACREAATWPDRFPGSDVFVSVNLAAAQTHEASLVGDVRQVLAETGLTAGRLQLELTESALMATSGAPLQALHSLADHGVRVAIDDFGTGYSSLAYLRSLPVHALKLPKQFIEGLGVEAADDVRGVDERIVDALIRLAHAIDLTVTAEGVEHQAQADKLCALGCDSAQGWHIAEPTPADDLAALFAG
ncbi:MAG: EAL domain-containing protein [Micromonosporaceae bacterium]|nr:EAL domain-containing protein [Micromonosporaceae bacterium]